MARGATESGFESEKPVKAKARPDDVRVFECDARLPDGEVCGSIFETKRALELHELDHLRERTQAPMTDLLEDIPF